MIEEQNEKSAIEGEQKEEKSISSGEPEKCEKDLGVSEKWIKYLEEESDKRNVYFQYRVINNHGIITEDNANFDNISFKDSTASKKSNRKESVFKDKKIMLQWLSDYYESYAMALMIATAVFDSFPDTWVIRAAERLFESFEDHEEADRTCALEEILNQFGAEICKGELNTYTGKVDVNIIRLTKAEYKELILKCIWQQYPQLQNKVMRWLQNYNVQQPVSMSKRALEIMGKLACWDYYFFLDKMIPQIPHDESILTDMMMGQILIILNQQENYRKNIYHLLFSWSKEKKVHYLLTALFVCAQLQDKNDILQNVIECYIQRTLEEIQNRNISDYQLRLYDFLGVGIRSYVFYKILIEQLYDRVSADASLREKKDVYELFLRLFAIDISQSSPGKGDEVILIKLCMVNHAVVDQICYIWQMVWQSNYCKKMLYSLMGQYEVKIHKTDSKYGIKKFIDKTLKDIYTREVRKDICNKIHRRARDVYSEGREF